MSAERWSSRIGAIVAVSASAVGLGNFLRFPGKAAQYGGGAFMIPYFVSLCVLGIPIAWTEWTIGRMGGRRGFHSAPFVFRAAWPHPLSPYIGGLALFVPFAIYCYYVYIESWCLGYAWFYLTGALPLHAKSGGYGDFFNTFVGAKRDGALFTTSGATSALVFLGVSFALNFFLVYRGLTKGIETFCKWAMPILIVAAVAVLVRVLTLDVPDASHPERNVLGGLGFMWNPHGLHGGQGILAGLRDPQIWLEAAGQVFFTLSVGFGIVICYASYVHPDEDIVLSALSSCAANEFCEVCLGGLITLPAAFVFLGAAPLADVLGSTLGLGFHTFPRIFEHMPAGGFFGFLWFFLLFLAAITSSIAMLHPVVVFPQEGLRFGKQRSFAFLFLASFVGCLVVVFFSKGLVALDTMDFWVGSVGIFVLGTSTVTVFAWALPIERGMEEANRGADFPIPRVFAFLLKWVCPAYLVLILVSWLYNYAGAYARRLLSGGSAVAMTFMVSALLGLGLLVRVAVSNVEQEIHKP